MNKYWLLVLCLGLSACNIKEESYYLSHPKALQQVIQACPNQQPLGWTCDQAQALGVRMNNLAYQLQASPQGFGIKILTLQQTIALQQQQQRKEKTVAEGLIANLNKNKNDLADLMAVVKWLESPVSS